MLSAVVGIHCRCGLYVKQLGWHTPSACFVVCARACVCVCYASAFFDEALRFQCVLCPQLFAAFMLQSLDKHLRVHSTQSLLSVGVQRGQLGRRVVLAVYLVAAPERCITAGLGMLHGPVWACCMDLHA